MLNILHVPSFLLAAAAAAAADAYYLRCANEQSFFFFRRSKIQEEPEKVSCGTNRKTMGRCANVEAGKNGNGLM